MSEFQRFITYINLYEENSKIRNAGFAKIERRNDQCKMEIHMRGTGFTGISCPVYLFVRENETLWGISVGNLSIQSGNGEGRFSLDATNLAQSGCDLRQAGGLIIFVNDKVMFASQWDEKDIRRERFVRLEDQLEKTVSAPEGKETNEKRERPESNQDMDIEAAESSLKATEAAAMLQSPIQFRSMPRQQNLRPPIYESKQGAMPENKRQQMNRSQQAGQNRQLERGQQAGQNQQASQSQEPVQSQQTSQHQQATQNQQGNNAQQANTPKPQEQEQPWAQKWQYILEQYPVLTPFEGEENILCVRLELKDIRILPKRYWYLGNNSFLLHGFFNYRYLIVGAIEQEGKKRWFLGVPGVFQSQEKVMAAIFGFPEYKSEKTANQKTGQFGYWYRFMDE